MHEGDAPVPVNGPPPPPVLSPEEEAERLQRQLAAQRIRTARKTMPEVRYAGFLVRALALLIDVAVLAASGAALVVAGLVGVHVGLAVLEIPPPIGLEKT